MRIRRRTKRRIRRFLKYTPLIMLGIFLYFQFRSPTSAKPSDIRVDMSPGRIERGRYIFTALADCDGCHSQRDYSKLYAPVVPSGRGAGSVIDQEGLPGQIVASNITPDRDTGIGTWTDGEKIRAIREGIGKDGRALFPMMPYTYYRRMSDDDVQSLVAYMNSLPPLVNRLPRTQVSYLTSMFMKSEPQPVSNQIFQPDTGAGQVYGEYLATIAACQECHTQASWRGKLNESLNFAGGRLFATSHGKVSSANITPHAGTGIGKWDFNRFRDTLQTYGKFVAQGPPQATPQNFTVMPYEAYSQLTNDDIEAMFLYLKAQAAIENAVNIHPAGP